VRRSRGILALAWQQIFETAAHSLYVSLGGNPAAAAGIIQIRN
jgi:hypothetical protein